MDPNQSSSGAAPSGGAQKKNKKNRSQKSDNKEQLPQQQQQNQGIQKEPSNRNKNSQKSDNKEQLPQQKQQHQGIQKEPSTSNPDEKNCNPSKGKKGKNIESQKSSNPNQNQPKGTKPDKAADSLQKQPKNEESTKKSIISQSDQQIEQQISILRNTLCIPKRKSQYVGGTLGRKTEVEVNYLPLNLDKLFKKTVYHIDVQFEPDLPKKLLRTALEEFNNKHYPSLQFAFDGRRNMYTSKIIKGKSDTVSIENDENKNNIIFKVTTAVVNAINMTKIEDYLKNGSSNAAPGEAFQALDIVLKNRPFALRFTNVGRSFYPVPRNTPVDLGEGMELWKGFFQSPVMGWKPFLNIDVAHKGFPKYQPLTSYISNELKWNLNSEMDSWTFNTLLNYIKGLKVDFMIPNQPNTKRTFKVVGLFDSAVKFFFVVDNTMAGVGKDGMINVVNYFKTHKGYSVKYPNLPCLHVGSPNKKTAIPIELCVVQRGQMRLKKLTESQTAIMVRNAARPPKERSETIKTCIKDISYNQDNVLKDFGISVADQFACIPARVLDQPSLAYAQKETKPKAGVWRAEKFAKAASLHKWVVVNLDSRTRIESIKNFEKCLMMSGRELNVIVEPMNPVVSYILPRNPSPDLIRREITNIFNKLKDTVDLIVVVIPDYPSGVYAIVKQSSELQVGVLTQCIKSKTIFKMNNATSSNILLKINSKLNGVNHTLAVRSSPPSMEGAIIFGADVTHPSPDQLNIPSVAAVAASHDIRGSQYNMEWRLQSPKVEIIQDLEDIVHKQLIKFREKTKSVPKKIFYFRDGVSEGQFLQLLEYELVAIRRACLRLNINYRPAVTFLVVQKRHHTRMFPKHNIDMDGKFCNISSGTIIDSQITHPTELDFYLCSHASIQGTSRPTKYHLIWDDNNFNEDQLEQLTFYLCFLFARCTRSVSYPAPTYYAHLAAFRARTYIENKAINLNRLDEEQTKNTLNHSFATKTPMFFV